MENAFVIIVGIILCILGITNIRGNISSIHWYNRTKVKPEDVKKYGKAVGTGTLVIGISIIISNILYMIFDNEIFMSITLVGVIIGLAFMLYGQFKYNKGIF